MPRRTDGEATCVVRARPLPAPIGAAECCRWGRCRMACCADRLPWCIVKREAQTVSKVRVDGSGRKRADGSDLRAKEATAKPYPVRNSRFVSKDVTLLEPVTLVQVPTARRVGWRWTDRRAHRSVGSYGIGTAAQVWQPEATCSRYAVGNKYDIQRTEAVSRERRHSSKSLRAQEEAKAESEGGGWTGPVNKQTNIDSRTTRSYSCNAALRARLVTD